MENITFVELTPSEALDIQGGTDSCAAFARDVGEFLGTAFQLIRQFGEGAAEFDWATMK